MTWAGWSGLTAAVARAVRGAGPGLALGWSHHGESDGTMNLIGALRRAMATTGSTDLEEFQRIEFVMQ